MIFRLLQYTPLFIALFSFGATAAIAKPQSYYDAGIGDLSESYKTPEQYLGIEIGSRHLYHHEVISYLRALDTQSDRMVSLGVKGHSHGGRPLELFAIGAPEILEDLAELQEQRLEAFREGRALPEGSPLVLYVGLSVHGDEPSPVNASVLFAHALVSAESEEVAEWLEKVLVILDPAMNPDGIDRFAHWTNSQMGKNPSSDPNDSEHRQGMATGRTNYYWFDLNRDWLLAVHPSSQARLGVFHTWKPNVLLDFHEMSTNSTYFFQPGVPTRVNPRTPERNQELTQLLADYYRDSFDQIGQPYFSEERYDDYYIGKGSTYPDVQGTIGILFEQASSRGFHQESIHGLLEFHTTIKNQLILAIETVSAMANEVDALAEYQADFWKKALEDGETSGGTFLFHAKEDTNRLKAFASWLDLHDIRHGWTKEEQDFDAGFFPAGSIAVPAFQTQYPFIRAMMDIHTEFEDDIFYDVSTWHVPLAYDLEYTTEPVAISADAWGEATEAASVSKLESSELGYLVDWRDLKATEYLAQWLLTGVDVRVATKSLSIQDGDGLIELPPGTLWVRPGDSELDNDALRAAVASVRSWPVQTYYTPAGIDLGSNAFEKVEQPKVLLLTGPGFDQYLAGALWHYFDQRLNLPITHMRHYEVPVRDLSDYSHILLVEGSRELEFLGESVETRILDFVRAGGNLVTYAGAIEWAVKQEELGVEFREVSAPEDEPEERMRRRYEQSELDLARELVRGSFFEADVDVSHPIGYGFADSTIHMLRTENKFMELSDRAYSTPVAYVESPLVSGYASQVNQELASSAASVLVRSLGEGRVVLMSDFPHFRGYLRGVERLTANAVFFSEIIDDPRSPVDPQ